MHRETDRSDFGRPVVVIVDAESLYRWFVTESLKREGMSVPPFESLADAAGHLNGRLPDLALIDAQTMNDDGVQSLVALRQQLPALQWLVLEPAGPGNPPTAVAGAASTPKPVDPDALRLLVRAHLRYAA